MRDRLFLTPVLIFMIILPAVGQDEWQSYEYHDFKIDFYQEPVHTSDTSQFDSFSVVTHYWEVDITDTMHQNIYYSISLTAYPPEYLHSDSLFSVVEGILNGTQQNVQEDSTFSLLSSILIERQGYPGKAFKWKSLETNKFFEFQVYLIKNTVFILSVVSKSGESHNLNIKKYFNSFEIVNTPKGTYSLPILAAEPTFKIDFPGVPVHSSKTIDSDYGTLHLKIMNFKPVDPTVNLVYVAMETKYLTQILDPKDLYALNSHYKTAIDAAIRSADGELISTSDIYYRTHLGKEFKCYISSGKFLMVYRLFYIENNMHMMGVLTLPDQDKNKEMNKFFNSYKILK